MQVIVYKKNLRKKKALDLLCQLRKRSGMVRIIVQKKSVSGGCGCPDDRTPALVWDWFDDSACPFVVNNSCHQNY